MQIFRFQVLFCSVGFCQLGFLGGICFILQSMELANVIPTYFYRFLFSIYLPSSTTLKLKNEEAYRTYAKLKSKHSAV